MEIRSAQVDDAKSIIDCLQGELGVETPIQALLHSLCEAKTLALVLDGPQGGFAGCALGWSVGSVGELTEIAILTQYRGRGYGMSLLIEFLAKMENRGVKEVQLEVRETNAVAISMYGRTAFKQVGRRPGYYADGTDALLYSRFF